MQLLKDTYTRLAEKEVQGQYYKKVHMYTLNPKSVTMGELYGEVYLASNEWHDGLLGVIIRAACAVIEFFFLYTLIMFKRFGKDRNSLYR